MTDNLSIIQQAYANFAAGNVPAVLAIFSPQINWNEAAGFPFIKKTPIIGPEAVVSDVLSKIPEYYDGFNIDAVELFGAGDKVVMAGYYQGTWKPTGKKFRANATHVWTLKDGHVTHFFQAVDTATIINP